MAQFYASIQGNRGGSTRMGTKASGISGHIRGWEVGCRVDMSHEGGVDVCRVYRTGGSNGSRQDEVLIAEFRSIPEGE